MSVTIRWKPIQANGPAIGFSGPSKAREILFKAFGEFPICLNDPSHLTVLKGILCANDDPGFMELYERLAEIGKLELTEEW